jgi:hypothetical protein
MEAGLADLIAANDIELDWLPTGSWRGIQQAIRTGQHHAFHFVGHGDFDAVADTGILQVCDDDGRRTLSPAVTCAICWPVPTSCG